MRGFSLVELSIVLVILGLLTGGILAGQSLIRAAELRAVTSEYQRITTAIQTFRDKYIALPGDMNNAVSFWNRQVNSAWCLPTSGATVTTPGTCNGNGDGTLTNPAAASQSGETFQFWRQLALSGLIEGTYTGLAGSISYYHADIGNNVPASKSGSNAGWSVRNITTGDTWVFTNWAASNALYLGGSTATNEDGDSPTLQPSELWNIDTKLDDGKPAYGVIQTYNATARANCATVNDPATAQYSLSSTGKNCNMVVRF